MQSHEPIHIDNDSSKPIIIPGKDSSIPNNASFVPESYQTARSFKTSPQAYQLSTSANSTHSQLFNNSYSHQFVNNFTNLRNPYNSHSPTSNFSPREEPPSFISQGNSMVESRKNPILPNPSIINSSSTPRPSLLTSKLASSNNIIQSQQSIPEPHQQHGNTFTPSSFRDRYQTINDQNSGSNQDENPSMGRSSNINIQLPQTSHHFKQSELVNSYTPYHNTPSVVSSSYSSASHSVPMSNVQSSSYQNQASYSRTPQNFQHTPVDHFYRSNQEPNNQSQTQKQSTTQTFRGGFTDFMNTDREGNQQSQYFEPQRSIESDTTQEEQVSSGSDNNQDENHLDIMNHPVDDLLMMLSALLQRIIEANDNLHPHHYHHASQLHDSNKLTVNVLAFHGRNVPAISIRSYLNRILKYCPVTNEVFLTLLVYFDRIAKSANTDADGTTEQNEQDQLFVMDSYNIHRLIIAGVTVASKFFSDVFYKNSRYAKVGGLPLDELNHLELQFLLLTDFRLLIQIEELQKYADLLLKFWKKEQSKKNEQDHDHDQQVLDQQQSHDQ